MLCHHKKKRRIPQLYCSTVEGFVLCPHGLIITFLPTGIIAYAVLDCKIHFSCHISSAFRGRYSTSPSIENIGYVPSLTFSHTSLSSTLKPIHQPTGSVPSGIPMAYFFSSVKTTLSTRSATPLRWCISPPYPYNLTYYFSFLWYTEQQYLSYPCYFLQFMQMEFLQRIIPSHIVQTISPHPSGTNNFSSSGGGLLLRNASS